MSNKEWHETDVLTDEEKAEIKELIEQSDADFIAAFKKGQEEGKLSPDWHYYCEWYGHYDYAIPTTYNGKKVFICSDCYEMMENCERAIEKDNT